MIEKLIRSLHNDKCSFWYTGDYGHTRLTHKTPIALFKTHENPFSQSRYVYHYDKDTRKLIAMYRTLPSYHRRVKL